MTSDYAKSKDDHRLTWRTIAGIFTPPQPVTIPMVVLFAIIPVYLYIAANCQVAGPHCGLAGGADESPLVRSFLSSSR
jgi:hypothetical protein